MKIYKINFQDNYGDYTGSLCQVYSNRAAAEKAKDWHSSHPDSCEPSLTYFIEEIDVDIAADEFVPPMSEEDYKHMCDNYYGDCDDEEYPEDYYDEYPEPTEEELEEHRRVEEMANELQEKMAEIEERNRRENAERIDQAIKLCEEIMNK